MPHLNTTLMKNGLYLQIYILYYFFVLGPSLVTPQLGYKPTLETRKHTIVTILIDHKDFRLKGDAEHFTMFLVFNCFAESQLGNSFQKENNIFECMNPNYSTGLGHTVKNIITIDININYDIHLL